MDYYNEYDSVMFFSDVQGHFSHFNFFLSAVSGKLWYMLAKIHY